MTNPDPASRQKLPFGTEMSFADFIKKHRGTIASSAAAEAQKNALPKKNLNIPTPQRGIQISDKAAELIALAIKDMLRSSKE